MIRLPSLDLVALYDIEPEIFKQFEYPKIYEPGDDHTVTERAMTADEKLDLIESILMDTEGLEVLYTNPEILQNRLGIYTRRRVGVWNDYSRGLGFRNTYNPTENVFEDTHTVRTIEVMGDKSNTETLNLANSNVEDRDLTSANTEQRNLSTSNTETRDLNTSGSEVKGYGERNTETLSSTEAKLKELDLSDVTDELNSKTTGSKTTKDLTDTTTGSETASETTVHDLSNMKDVTKESSEITSNDVRTLNTTDDTQERKTISEQTELAFTNRQDKTDVRNNQTEKVELKHDIKKSTTDSEAIINSDNGIGNESANVAVTQSANAGHGTASNVSLPIDNAQTRTHKTSEEYDAAHNTDTTTTSYTRPGSEGDVTVTDKLGSETTTKRYGVGQVDPYDSSKITRTGTDSNAKTDSGTKNTTTTHEGSEETTVSGTNTSTGTETHKGTEDVTGNESGTLKSTTDRTGTESESVTASDSKEFKRDGSDSIASVEAQTGSVSSDGTDTGSVNRNATEGGSVENKGTQTGTVGNIGAHSEKSSDEATISRHGNIGVTKSSDLIAAHLELVKKDLFTFVIQDIKHKFTLEVY